MKRVGWALVAVTAVCGVSVAVSRAGDLRAVDGYAWLVLVLLGLGAVVGAAYARTQRGWGDYQYHRRQVPIARRAFAGNAWTLLKRALLVGVLLWVAYVGIRAGSGR